MTKSNMKIIFVKTDKLQNGNLKRFPFLIDRIVNPL